MRAAVDRQFGRDAHQQFRLGLGLEHRPASGQKVLDHLAAAQRLLDPPVHAQKRARIGSPLCACLDELDPRGLDRPGAGCVGLRDDFCQLPRPVPELVGVEWDHPVGTLRPGLLRHRRDDLVLAQRPRVDRPVNRQLFGQALEHPGGRIGGAVVDDDDPLAGCLKVVDDVQPQHVHFVARHKHAEDARPAALRCGHGLGRLSMSRWVTSTVKPFVPR